MNPARTMGTDAVNAETDAMHDKETDGPIFFMVNHDDAIGIVQVG
jgi:hypothetical protein